MQQWMHWSAFEGKDVVEFVIHYLDIFLFGGSQTTAEEATHLQSAKFSGHD